MERDNEKQEADVLVPEELAELDFTTALARVGGDEELLKEIAEIFLAEFPDAIAEVRKAVGRRDADGLQRAAHSLKGAVGNFCAQDAVDAALRLEMMGRNCEFGNSGEALQSLESALASLKPKLAKLVSG